MASELQLIDRLISMGVFSHPQYSHIPKLIMSNGTGVKLPRSLTAPTPIPTVVTITSELNSIETVVRAAADKIFQTAGISSAALPAIPTMQPTSAPVPKPAKKKHARYNLDHISFFNAIPPQQSSSITTKQFHEKFPEFLKSRESIQKRLKHAADTRGNRFSSWCIYFKQVYWCVLLFFCFVQIGLHHSRDLSPLHRAALL